MQGVRVIIYTFWKGANMYYGPHVSCLYSGHYVIRNMNTWILAPLVILGTGVMGLLDRLAS